MFENIKKIFNKFFIRKKHFKLYRGQECYEISYDPKNKIEVHKELERAVNLYRDLTEPGRIKRRERIKKINKIISKNK